MESCNRTQSNGRLWLILFAALGTFLLAFIPSGAWLNGTQTAAETLSAILLKQVLCVLLLLVVPSLWAGLAFRISPWMLLGLSALAFGCGLLVTGKPVDALYSALLAALPGAGLWGLLKLKLSNFRAVIYGSFAILAALFGFVCLKDLIRTGDAYASFRELIRLYGQFLRGIALPDVGLEGLTEEIASLIDSLRANAENYCIPLLLMPAMAAALSNVLFAHLWTRNGGADLTPLPRFSEWRCERWYVLLSAGLLLVTMFLGMAGVGAANALSGVAAVMWRMPCMLGGLCAVRRIGLLTGRKWLFWAAIVLLVLMPTAMSMILSLIGLMSALRKPMNVGEDGKRK